MVLFFHVKGMSDSKLRIDKQLFDDVLPNLQTTIVAAAVA